EWRCVLAARSECKSQTSGACYGAGADLQAQQVTQRNTVLVIDIEADIHTREGARECGARGEGGVLILKFGSATSEEINAGRDHRRSLGDREEEIGCSDAGERR